MHFKIKNRTIFLIAIICLAGSASPLYSQSVDNAWQTLSRITFKKQYDELLGFKIDVPVFSDVVKKLEGQEVQLRGYIIPTDGYKSHKEFVFSAYPYNMCFFCGQAGPETVIEVYANEAIKYTAEPVVIKGRLELNDTDVNRLMYALRDVKLIGS